MKKMITDIDGRIQPPGNVDATVLLRRGHVMCRIYVQSKTNGAMPRYEDSVE